MLKKKTKIIILSAMVLLLGITGYLNITLNNQTISTGANQTTTSTYNYFDSYRTDRSATRDQEILYYTAIMQDESSSADDKAKAQEKKLALISEMENELALEYLIKGLGFSDAIVTTSSNYINVIVKSSELNSSEVAKIVSVVTENTDFTLSAIKVIPVV
ncbi:MAG: SpoIIIAH-like family protein [Clostridia bacterium]|nr:SpoIIIAH-like family protein [Clostridia bacterium]